MKTTDSVCNEVNYNILFKNLSKDMYRYAYYRIGEQELAKDLVQDAFIKLWQNCKKVSFENSKFYLLRVLKNKTIDIYRTKKIKIEYSSLIDKRIEKETPLFKIEYKEYENRLNQALAKMPEKQRITFLMNRIDGMKYKTISTTLDISIKTVEYRMQKALAFLRKELGVFNK